MSAWTPPRSTSNPCQGQRNSPSVHMVCNIASITSSLCGCMQYINDMKPGIETVHTASSSLSVIEGHRRTCGGVRAHMGQRWRTWRWLSVVSKHVRLVGVMRSVNSLDRRISPLPAPGVAPSFSPSHASTIIGPIVIVIAIKGAVGMRAGADRGAWLGNLCRARASRAGRGRRGFSFV